MLSKLFQVLVLHVISATEVASNEKFTLNQLLGAWGQGGFLPEVKIWFLFKVMKPKSLLTLFLDLVL